MTGVVVHTEELTAFRRKVRKWMGRSAVAGPVATKQLAEILRDKVKKNASGRPGPEVVTGAYRESIRITEDVRMAGPTTSYAAVGTDAPQAMRLEFGYFGTDSLGRHYSQPPYWHWRPAMLDMGPEMKRVGTRMIGMIFYG